MIIHDRKQEKTNVWLTLGRLTYVYQGHPTTVFSLMLLDAVLGYLEYF